MTGASVELVNVDVEVLVVDVVEKKAVVVAVRARIAPVRPAAETNDMFGMLILRKHWP